MNPRASLSLSSLLTFSLFLLISSPASAFNITKLFDRHPEFSNFNDYLTQTKLASEINSRQTITVLAVENSQISSLSGRTLDVVKKILSMHVVLDYYDAQKLQDLSNKTALLTTMFQSTGTAHNRQGFLNVTILSNGEVAFGSAVKGSGLDAKLIKSVAAQPYNISVLQISSPLIAPGIDVATPPPPPQSPAAAPKPSKKADAKSPKAAKAPAPADDVPPSADAPDSANAPEAVADSPAPSPSPKPADDVADKKAAAPSPSSGSRVVFGYGFGVLMGLVMLSF